MTRPSPPDALLIDTSENSSNKQRHSPTPTTPIMDSAVWRDVSSLAHQFSTNTQQSSNADSNASQSTDNSTITITSSTTTAPSPLTQSTTQVVGIQSVQSQQQHPTSTGSTRNNSNLSKKAPKSGRKLVAKCSFEPEDELPPIEIYEVCIICQHDVRGSPMDSV